MLLYQEAQESSVVVVGGLDDEHLFPVTPIADRRWNRDPRCNEVKLCLDNARLQTNTRPPCNKGPLLRSLRYFPGLQRTSVDKLTTVKVHLIF